MVDHLLLLLSGIITLIILLIAKLTGSITSIKGGMENNKNNKNALTLKDVKIKFSNLEDSVKYEPNVSPKFTNWPVIHIGQRKLFLNELQFLTHNVVDVVIYAGSSPSMHIWKLHLLFPNVVFILVDPNECCIMKDKKLTHYESPEGVMYLEVGTDDKKYYSGSKKINYLGKRVNKEEFRGIAYNGDFTEINANKDTKVFIIENIFTIDLAKRLKLYLDKANVKFAFWSDIRTNLVDDAYPTELDIYWNSAQQLTWVDILKPTKTMLKFRCPYSVEPDLSLVAKLDNEEHLRYCKDKFKLDFIEDYKNKKFRYIDGDAYIQPWCGQNSTETRLVFSDVVIREYDLYDWENKLRYYNINDRISKYSGFKTNQKECIDNCGDCALEAIIWDDYKQVRDNSIVVLDEMIGLKNYTGTHPRILCNGNHGKLYL
jgi:hypothetical protein